MKVNDAEKEVNPVIKTDYPDPDVIRVGNTYYMVSTTMHYMPGCEILRSYDLVHWEHAAYVYDRLDSTPGQRMENGHNIYGKGMWAASLRYYRDWFYICFSANDTGKTYLYFAQDIHGPWEKQQIKGFYHDSSLLFDDDDRVYIVSGNTQIRLTELKEDLSGPKDGGTERVIVSEEAHPFLGYEGSHFYKINGRYYLFLIHSLRERWMRVQACFAADSLEGKFRGADVCNDDRGYCGQGTAQGGIVDTPDGKWYAVLFQDYGAVGRVPVLLPVYWKDGFPVFGESGSIPASFQVPHGRNGYRYRPLVQSDDFRYRGFISDSAEGRRTAEEEYDSFGFKSCWQINHEPQLQLLCLDSRRGGLCITAGKICRDVLQARNVLTQRMMYPECAGETAVYAGELKDGDYAGICAFTDCYGMVALTRRHGQYYIVMQERTADYDGSGQDMKLDTSEAAERECILLSTMTAKLRVDVDFHQMKDIARFYYDTGEGWRRIGCEKKLSFSMKHFSGCRFGLFVYATKQTGGMARFEKFIYHKKCKNFIANECDSMKEDD